MNSVVFIDTEVGVDSGKIKDIGAVKPDGSVFHWFSIREFLSFIRESEFICGHNIIKHDLEFLQKKAPDFDFNKFKVIDTLHLSPLLFPAKPYHKLIKDDKLQSDDLNNPVNDSIKARDLFYDEVNAFKKLDNEDRKSVV